MERSFMRLSVVITWELSLEMLIYLIGHKSIGGRCVRQNGFRTEQFSATATANSTVSAATDSSLRTQTVIIMRILLTLMRRHFSRWMTQSIWIGAVAPSEIFRLTEPRLFS